MPLTFANKITISRILIVPFFVGAIFSYSPDKDYLRFVALCIFFLAVLTDIFDGYVARVHNQSTRLGAILDPLADKFLLISAFFSLYKMNIFLKGIEFPAGLMVVVIVRDFILMLGAMIIYLAKHDLNIVPTLLGKMTTVLQMLSVIGILLQWSFFSGVWMLALIFTIVSGLDYIRVGMKLLKGRVKPCH